MMNDKWHDSPPRSGPADVTEALQRLDAMSDGPATTAAIAQPDRRDGSVYRCPPGLLLALKTSLVTGRPLLVQGRPGSGKSSIAPYVARNLNWRYYEYVVDARTEPSDLLWRFDLVRRLADAQVKKAAALNDADYVEPGVLWWMLARDSARRRGAPVGGITNDATDPSDEIDPSRDEGGAVLLIDEIDKAEPDVPGGLLVPLGSFRFTVTDTGVSVEAGQDSPWARLIVITTNDDRELPAPFVRRCVLHRLDPPGEDDLVEIAERHLAAEGHDIDMLDEQEHQLLRRLAATVAKTGDSDQPGPSIAEFMDAVRALRQLGSSLGAEDLAFVERLLLNKGEVGS